MKKLLLAGLTLAALFIVGCAKSEEPAAEQGPSATETPSVGAPVSSGAAVGETSAVKGEGGPPPRTATGE